MRIGQVTYSYQPIKGGGDAYLAQLFAVLKNWGHSQRVYQRQTNAQTPELRMIPNPFRGLPGEFWSQALWLPLMRRELLSEDLLIFHYPIYLMAFDKLCLGRHRPIRIGFSHGVTWDDRPGAFRSRLKYRMARYAFQRAEAFVANDTNFLREMGLEIKPKERMFSQVAPGIWFIPNAVDAKRFRPNPGLPEFRKLNAILVPRNLFYNRGVHLAIQAFARFASIYDDPNLLIVGEPSQREYAAWLRNLAKELQISDRVIFWGSIPYHQMAKIYASCQLTLIPSICGEGTSLAALESMACGTACISTDAAGLKDLPTYQCLPSAESLAQAMLDVYPKREAIGSEQCRQVCTEYHLDRWAEAWQDVVRHAQESASRKDF